jgi:hypothetical protein
MTRPREAEASFGREKAASSRRTPKTAAIQKATRPASEGGPYGRNKRKGLERLGARGWTRVRAGDRMRAERYFDAGEGAKAV